MSDRSEYWRTGRAAVAEGLITEDELKIIACVGTRKEWAWARHLLDLKEIIADRRRRHSENLGRSDSQALQALLEGQNRLSETVSKRRIKRVVRGPDNRISHAIEELEP